MTREDVLKRVDAKIANAESFLKIRRKSPVISKSMRQQQLAAWRGELAFYTSIRSLIEEKK
jgi:hypothetical protein